MSEVIRLWRPETAARRSSTEASLEPIALEARLAEARARRTHVLAAKSGSPASTPPPPAVPAAARAVPHEPPAFLTSLAAGVIAAVLGAFWIVDSFAASTMDDSAPHATTVPPAAPVQLSVLLTSPLSLPTNNSLHDASAVAHTAQTDLPQTPLLSAPYPETANAVLVDEGLRPPSPFRALPPPAIMGQPSPPFPRVRELTNYTPDAPTVSEGPMAFHTPVSSAAISPDSAVIPSLFVPLPAAARELPAAAREFPLSDDGPNYRPPMICYRATCYFATRCIRQSPSRRPGRSQKRRWSR